MNPAVLVDSLHAAGVALWVAGDRVRWRGPPGRFAASDQDLIARHRDEVITLLTADPSAADRERASGALAEAIEERAGILEHAAALSRLQAERLAAESYRAVLYRLASWPRNQWWSLILPTDDDAAEQLRRRYPAAALEGVRLVPLSSR